MCRHLCRATLMYVGRALAAVPNPDFVPLLALPGISPVLWWCRSCGATSLRDSWSTSRMHGWGDGRQDSSFQKNNEMWPQKDPQRQLLGCARALFINL